MDTTVGLQTNFKNIFYDDKKIIKEKAPILLNLKKVINQEILTHLHHQFLFLLTIKDKYFDYQRQKYYLQQTTLIHQHYRKNLVIHWFKILLNFINTKNKNDKFFI